MGHLGSLPALVRDVMVFLEPSFLHVNLLGRESLVLWWLVLTVALRPLVLWIFLDMGQSVVLQRMVRPMVPGPLVL